MDLRKAAAARARNKERSAIFASVAGQPRTLFDSVRRRLVLVVLLAMAPIAALNIIQGVMQLNGAEEEARQHLVQRALGAAATQESVFASAENVLYALRNVEDVYNSGPSCQATLRGATVSLPFVANISVLDPSGRVLCAAIESSDRDVGDEAWWQGAIRNPGFSLTGRVESSAARAQVLVGILPLRTASGQLEGALAIGIDTRWLDNLLRQQTPPSIGVATLFSAAGEELATNSHGASAALFDPARVLGSGDSAGARTGLRESRDQAGGSWTFATARLERQKLTMAFAMPSDRLFGWTFLAITASLALPAVIMALSLVVLWVAVDRMILRWLLYLRRVTAVYAQGHYGFRPSRLDAAPSEFRILGHAVENMAFAVRQRDARLREGLAEKTALVREIHHRIKNSLQVVVSLLSLYGSGIGRGENRRRFEQLRTRVNTLALVHRILYEASDGSQVRLRELLRELASLLEGSTDSSARIAVEAEDLNLPTDMAVPLALMVVELVLSLAPRTGASPAQMVLRGGTVGACLRLTVRSVGENQDEPAEQASLAGGFATQLGGGLKRSIEADGAVVVTGDFPCRPRPAEDPY
ncbi:sensor histidine kinase [Xanthobacter autotrophicus DSM 431]|uniref:sensor histidine kinase n=1 Tax=Xanthobacter nonsaccharivorans TaxID=3119912 RepID=UPI0037267CB4